MFEKYMYDTKINVSTCQIMGV